MGNNILDAPCGGGYMINAQLVPQFPYGGELKMPSNDAIALEANFKGWSTNRFPNGAPKNLNIFEYYCLDQLLRQYSIGDSQIKTGMVGGGGDGGIDGLYMFVNNEM